MLIDFLALPLASLPLVIGFVRGKDGVGNKDRFVPSIFEDDIDKDFSGIRCPSCGMTTSWAHLLQGDAIAAFRANAGGALLAAGALVCGPWLLISGVRGRWLVAPPHEGLTLAAGLVIVAVTLIDWTLRVSLGW